MDENHLWVILQLVFLPTAGHAKVMSALYENVCGFLPLPSFSFSFTSFPPLYKIESASSVCLFALYVIVLCSFISAIHSVAPV